MPKITITEKKMVKNITNVFDQSTEAERAYGSLWYVAAHSTAARIAVRYNASIGQVVGVIAALSPMTKWSKNLLDAENMVKAWSECKEAPPASTFPAQVKKAWSILTTTDRYNPLAVFPEETSPKTRAFYQCILMPGSNTETVVVDGHTFNISQGVRRPLKDIGTITPKQYRQVANAFIETWKGLRTQILSPQALQATCWLTWRRMR